jgi:2-keto-4-pentenoate hydratase/2-oxohepta-3-ene-1,7-dioic acid hydratase in catechol pathway
MTRLASYAYDGQDHVGLLAADGLLHDLRALQAAAPAPGEAPIPATMLEIVEAGEPVLAALERLARLAPIPGPAGVAPEDVVFHPPVRRPSKIVCMAVNNSGLRALAVRYPDHPTFFLKAPSTLIGHRGVIDLPDHRLVHPEAEVALVIGRRASRVKAADALDYVFGYTVLDDVTSPTIRDDDLIRLRPGTDPEDDIVITVMGRHKSTDTFGPCGPYLVTSDEIPDPNALGVRVWIDDVLVTEDSTANHEHYAPAVIEQVSHALTLEPGDLISLGTAASQRTWPLYKTDLGKYGGPLRIEIEGLGTLESEVTVAGETSGFEKIPQSAPTA